MTPAEVQARVLAEIGQHWDKANAHGVDLRWCLVPPEKREFLDMVRDTESFDLWVVLEEIPTTKAGYKIVYDEENNRFGLAIVDENETIFYLGPYGTFMDALEAM